MAIDPAALLALDMPETAQRYEWRDCALYALGVGAGFCPEDPAGLAFLDDRHPRALPSLATILGFGRFWIERVPTGIDPAGVLHAEQGLRILSPIPPVGTASRRIRVVGVEDRGPGHGAFVLTEETVRHVETGRDLAQLTSTILCRREGGCGSLGRARATPPVMPDRPADDIVEIAGWPQQAHVYRLSGDLNPLHSDPAFARAAGFAGPVLHGLATFGTVCRTLMAGECGNDPERVAAQHVRFSGAVYPGERLSLRLWRERPADILFELWSTDRAVKILDLGRFRMAEPVRTA
jgi:acyl dehydratase